MQDALVYRNRSIAAQHSTLHRRMWKER